MTPLRCNEASVFLMKNLNLRRPLSFWGLEWINKTTVFSRERQRVAPRPRVDETRTQMRIENMTNSSYYFINAMN